MVVASGTKFIRPKTMRQPTILQLTALWVLVVIAVN